MAYKYKQIPPPARLSEVVEAFDPDMLKKICSLPEEDFGQHFDLDYHHCPKALGSENFYWHRSTGASVLAVAHLDTVVDDPDRRASIMDTVSGPLVVSGALDDRLGAYVILDMLPRLGVHVDYLLTVGEESGASTAEHFDLEEGADYNWIIEFDRGGSDVVMYQYKDSLTTDLVEETGARVSTGSFSDISYLEHLKIKAFNWGVGYQDYHGPRGHAWLNDTFEMVGRFLTMHETWHDVKLDHEERKYAARGRNSSKGPKGISGGSKWGSSDAWWGGESSFDWEAYHAERAAQRGFGSGVSRDDNALVPEGLADSLDLEDEALVCSDGDTFRIDSQGEIVQVTFSHADPRVLVDDDPDADLLQALADAQWPMA